MPWCFRIRAWLPLLTLGVILIPLAVTAQDDPNEVPLGDVARNLRKKGASRSVIDDDNLSEALREGEMHRGLGPSLRFLMAGDLSGFRVSAPDVTCNLSFSSNVRTLLSSQYSEMNLPADDLERLEGRASIAGDSLTISVHNGTDWHVSEISVAFTMLRGDSNRSPLSAQGDSELSVGATDSQSDKKPDTTVIYRMRAVGVPWAVTTFSSRLNDSMAGSGNWHWAIVAARGYPPESYRRGISSQSTAETRQDPVPERSQPVGPSPTEAPVLTPVSHTRGEKPQLVPSSTSQ